MESVVPNGRYNTAWILNSKIKPVVQIGASQKKLCLQNRMEFQFHKDVSPLHLSHILIILVFGYLKLY